MNPTTKDNSMKKPDRKNIQNAAIVTTGVVAAVALYRLGYKDGAKLDSMAKDLVAHQMITMQLRASHPELVDQAVKTMISQIDGIVAAAN